jgi:hypothetical protein
MRHLLWSFILGVGLTLPASAQEKVTDAGPTKALKVTDANTSKKTGEYFEFKGGSLRDFLDEIAVCYGADLRKIGTIPETMLNFAEVPKIRMKRQGDDFTPVLNLYNSISEEGARGMGKWIIKQRITPDNRVSAYDRLNALVLVQTEGQNDDVPFAVKAFPLNGITREELDKLRQVVEEEWDLIRMNLAKRSHQENMSAGSWGRLNYHEGTGILVAVGSKGYVELAGEIIEAYKSSHHIDPEHQIKTNR